MSEPSPTTLPIPRVAENLPETAQEFGPESLFMDGKRFEQVCRTARLMAHQSFCPKHLKGVSEEEGIANCFQVVCQALRWGFDPFAIKDETYVVQNKLGYSGKLVAAVINARARLKRRLDYRFSGEGLDRAVTVIGWFEGEEEPRTATLSVRQAKTSNAMWTNDPDQKLVYSGVIRWARRWCPELVLGVLTDDDLEKIQESSRSNGPPVGITDLRGYRKAMDPTVIDTESHPQAGPTPEGGSPPAGGAPTAPASPHPAGTDGSAAAASAVHPQDAGAPVLPPADAASSSPGGSDARTPEAGAAVSKAKDDRPKCVTRQKSALAAHFKRLSFDHGAIAKMLSQYGVERVADLAYEDADKLEESLKRFPLEG